jgi:hypothetical protein
MKNEGIKIERMKNEGMKNEVVVDGGGRMRRGGENTEQYT